MAQLFLGEQAISSGNSGSNVTSLSELTNDMNFKSIIYLTNAEYTALISANTIDDEIIYIVTDIDGATGGSGGSGSGIDYIDVTKAEYESLVESGGIEEDKFYVITDIATDDDLPSVLSTTQVEKIINDKKEETLSDINSAKDTAIIAVSTQQTTSVNAVKSQQTTSVSAVSTQQTASVNAVTEAKDNAVSQINSIVETIPFIIILTQEEYESLDMINPNVVYLLK